MKEETIKEVWSDIKKLTVYVRNPDVLERPEFSERYLSAKEVDEVFKNKLNLLKAL